MTTIRDVAKRLSLSITTISRALDGYGDVAEGTRKLVEQTAREMGYAPNRAARQLRRKRTDTLGYILPASESQFADPFFSEFIAGLGDQAATENFDLLVLTAAPGSEAEKGLFQRWVQGRKVDGMVLNRMRLYDWRVQYLSGQGLPFVSLEKSLDGVDHPYVEVDVRAGFVALIQHLVERGHRRIAYIGAGRELKIQSDRFAGYGAGMVSAGLELEPRLVCDGDLSRQSGYQATRKLLAMKNPPTAITCANDLTAIGALEAAHDLSQEVGRGLVVAGFDGIEESQHTQPPLTTLKQPVYEIAQHLVRMLVAMLLEQPLPERRVQLQAELLVRQSTNS
jgi:LacI family transcriptional regulator